MSCFGAPGGLVLLLSLTLLALPADAGEPGHFHPDKVAKESTLFVTAAEQLGPAFDTAQADLTRLSVALEQLDGALLLLGDRVPDGLRAWADDTRKQITGQYLQLQRHIDLVQEDYSVHFGDAVQRAVEAESAAFDLTECGATGINALLRRGAPAACAGEDRNAPLAARIDADPELQSFLEEMAEVPWPSIAVTARTWTAVAVTGTEQWLEAEALTGKLANTALARHNGALEEALDPLYEGLEGGDADAVTQGAAARAAYAAAVASDGTILLDAMQASLAKGAKKGGPAAVGVCPVPAALGGCEGAPSTKAILGALLTDKKFLKATAGIP